ncbi:FAD binding domain-containing protein [bacterium]|nr:FAD binding domain-containing protein [bacterium]
MRAFLPQYNLQRPVSLAEGLQLLHDQPGRFRPFAGGTDLMVLFNAGKLPAGDFLDISRFEELKGIEVSDSEVRLGALVTYQEILHHPVLQDEFPNLVQAAFWTGAAAIQNRGTLGGNAANASPAADTPPALLSYGARIELVSGQGRRSLDYSSFHLDYKKTALRPDELIAALIVPRPTQPRFHYYRKVGTRKAQAISKVCLAACADGGRVRLGFGAVAPVPAACPQLSDVLTRLGRNPLQAEVRQALHQEVTPIDDIRSNREYRRRVAENLLDQMWSEYLKWSP